MTEIAQYALAYHALATAILIVDSRGLIAFANRPLCQLFGYIEAELLGQPVEQLVPQSQREKHQVYRSAFERAPVTRSMRANQDLVGVSKTGVLLPLEIELSPRKIGEENCVIALVQDLTRLHAEIQSTRRAIDAASSAMIMCDARGKIVLANSKTSEMFGYSHAELMGSVVELLLPHSVGRAHRLHREDFAADPKKRSMADGQDLYGSHKDGSEFPVEVGLTPIENQGEIFTMATVIDITVRKRAAEQLVRKNQELSRLNGELTQFTYSASHDLKAPLATIEGLLRCIEEDMDAEDPASARDHAVRAGQLAKRTKGLIESILGFTRAQNVAEPARPVRLSALFAETEAIVAGQASREGVLIKTAVDADLSVVTQPTRLQQILKNLVVNGIIYAVPSRPVGPSQSLDFSSSSNPARSPPYVALRARREGGWLIVEVADNGIGIPSAQQDQVFKLFQRFGNHQRPGSGLGLAAAHKNVEWLGGSIEFKSDSSGTVFTIKLPAS